MSVVSKMKLFSTVRVRSCKFAHRYIVRSENGAAMLEFAIVSPLLILLTFGLIQYALAFTASISLQNASAVAARYAILSNPAPTNAQIEGVARQSVNTSVNPNNITVTITNETVNGVGGAKGVRLNYSFPAMFHVPGVVNGAIPLQAKTIMR